MDDVLGFITIFAGSFAPRNWAFCNGSLIAIASNTALYSVIGTTYGGNGINTFALPDLRGRAVVGAGRGISDYIIGDKGGAEILPPLRTKNIPEHTHPFQVTITPHAAGVANSLSPKDSVYATTSNQHMYEFSANVSLASYAAKIATSAEGSANPQLLSILHPVLAMNYIICVNGVFPNYNQ
ncbi:phage tail protein [Niastella caeni]|uniref:Phage tail protein n=1 Tax=Niastella caeni TaxID=2569763 RepID=A0A4S8HS33_9BACT|nr:tail fiber protein [Niastella caeni]THU38338.1 phage tail protein [Niastella caeni]